MTGNEAYENQFKSKSENLINKNQDKTYLRGFYNFIKGKYSTKHSYVAAVVRFMDYINKEVNEITLDDYNEYMAEMEKYTSSYQITVYSALKKFSLYLYKSNKSDIHPMSDVERPDSIEGIETKKKRENGVLDDDEVKRYISCIKNGAGNEKAIVRQKKWIERDTLIITLFLYTGLRCSALYKLNVSNIDFYNKKLIAVDKGGKIPEIILTDEILYYMYEWLEKRKSLLENSEEDALFISNQKNRMDQTSIYRIVTKYAKNITDKHISPHKLRATFGTRLMKKTGDIYFVQECMGHSNPKTTELYIRGLTNDNMIKQASIMSEIFN